MLWIESIIINEYTIIMWINNVKVNGRKYQILALVAAIQLFQWILKLRKNYLYIDFEQYDEKCWNLEEKCNIEQNYNRWFYGFSDFYLGLALIMLSYKKLVHCIVTPSIQALYNGKILLPLCQSLNCKKIY